MRSDSDGEASVSGETQPAAAAARRSASATGRAERADGAFTAPPRRDSVLEPCRRSPAGRGPARRTTMPVKYGASRGRGVAKGLIKVAASLVWIYSYVT